uniref:restriction endonuclease subunit S n=1 Tax=Burkholderia anthina TaxID=179879 RepID=UPI00158DDBB6|nr:restriction endonuclease subunit S [Burkholderia anthina]
MAFEHAVVRLGDYVDACLGKMLDIQKNRGVLQPYLGNSNVRWGTFELQDLAVMRFEEHEQERYGIEDGDLIVCEGGEPGRCAIWRGDVPAMKIQKALHRVRVKEGLDSNFLYYWFLQAGRTGALEPFFTGTTIKHLTGKALAELRIPLPPIRTQRGLARVLKSLDDKIGLNRRINQTLQAMAQAIFKSWFVDFAPVKAKIAAIQEGRDPLRAAMSAISGKSDAELDALPSEQFTPLAATAELFPDEMEEMELGEIPRGWMFKTVGDIAQFSSGKVDVSSLNENTYISTENMLENRGGVTCASSLPSVATVPSFSVGQILVSNIRPYFKKIWMAHFDGGRSPDVLAFVPVDPQWSEFLYNLMYQDSFFEFMTRTAKGAKMPRGDKDAIRGWTFPCPDEFLMSHFSEKFRPHYEHIHGLTSENHSLIELRNTLLPKLLFGELTAEALTEPTGAA